MHRRIAGLLSGPLLLAACSTQPKSYDALPPELRSATVVATLEPGARIPETATFSWMPASFVQLDARYDAAQTEARIRAVLEDALRRRGLYLVPNQRGQLWIGYAIAVEGALDTSSLDQVYGISRRGDRTVEHERGALILDIVDRGTRTPLWRGSVAILADPTLPEAVRRARVERGVDQLLDQLKSGY